jgi:Tfp pilus assembly protein PilF
MICRLGRFKAAALLCLFARLAFAQKPGSELDRAIALYQAGDIRGACSTLRQPAAHDSSDARVYLYSAGCALHEHDDKVLEDSRRALAKIAPASSPVHAVLGDWLAGAGRCGAAEQEYALAPPPGTAGAVAFALAQCLQTTGEPAAAVNRYKQAIGENPDREEYRLSLAFLLIGVGASEDAGRVLVDAAKRFPSSVRILVTMSLLHLELGYPDRARIGYEKARALEPDSPLVWKLLGRIQAAEGAHADAVASFEQAAAKDARDAQTWLWMGLSQVRLEHGAETALSDFQRALELDADLVEARLQSASIYLQNKLDYAKAAAELQRVLASNPDLARAHLLLVQAYQRLGQPEKAAVEARKYRELTQSRSAAPPVQP